MATATSQIGGIGYTAANVYTATSDPVASNDSADNKLVGDIVINTTTGSVFICVDNTATAAVWRIANVETVSYTWTPNTAANQSFFVATRACTVLAITARVDIAGTDAGAVTGAVVKAASGTALSSGTALHTGTVNLKGTAATNVLPTLAAAGTLAIPAGTAIGFQSSGVMTAAIGSVNVLLLQS